jgi:hypothetical protein
MIAIVSPEPNEPVVGRLYAALIWLGEYVGSNLRSDVGQAMNCVCAAQLFGVICAFAVAAIPEKLMIRMRAVKITKLIFLSI